MPFLLFVTMATFFELDRFNLTQPDAIIVQNIQQYILEQSKVFLFQSPALTFSEVQIGDYDVIIDNRLSHNGMRRFCFEPRFFFSQVLVFNHQVMMLNTAAHRNTPDRLRILYISLDFLNVLNTTSRCQAASFRTS